MSNLPYITAPGNIEKALNAIKSAATPPKVSQDFVKSMLKIKGGSGDQVTSYLKKIGFAGSDGTPTAVYKKFRNPATSGAAAAEALRTGYSALYNRNEYMHTLSDKDLKGLIIEETGLEHDASVVTLIYSSIKAIKSFASWDNTESNDNDTDNARNSPALPNLNHSDTYRPNAGNSKLNISYTINLNLPATSDVSVFNAIFKSLKENILKDSDE